MRKVTPEQIALKREEIIYTFYPFMFGIYPYTAVTEKQRAAMKEAGINYVYINQGIRENEKLSVNVVDESWLKDADRMGTISGNKVAMWICISITCGTGRRRSKISWTV